MVGAEYGTGDGSRHGQRERPTDGYPLSEATEQAVGDAISAIQTMHRAYTWRERSILLPIRQVSGTRITSNFDPTPLREGKRVQVEILGVPDEVAESIRFQVKADKTARADPVRSAIMGDGFVSEVEGPTISDRGYYLVLRSEPSSLRRYPDAAVLLRIVD